MIENVQGQKFEIGELVKCVSREINMRERVYPRWIMNGRLTQRKADQEIAMMKAVLQILIEKSHEQDLFASPLDNPLKEENQ